MRRRRLADESFRSNPPADLGSSLKFTTGGDALYKGQWDAWIVAYDARDKDYELPLGQLDYQSWKSSGDDARRYMIKLIEVRPNLRRRGIATRLYKKLFELESITEADLEQATQSPEGTAFRRGARLSPPKFVLTLDGSEVMRGTENEIFAWLHRHHSYSVDWALKYEGYAIVPVSQLSGRVMARAHEMRVAEDWSDKSEEELLDYIDNTSPYLGGLSDAHTRLNLSPDMFHWHFEDLPVASLLRIHPKKWWVQWYENERAARRDEDGDDAYFDELEQAWASDSVGPIIVVHIDGETDIADGWHRSAMAIVQGRRTVPAVVGRD